MNTYRKNTPHTTPVPLCDENNIYRIFFIFDGNYIVVLFHGFQKKTQKTPQTEIEKALRIRTEYYEYKKEHDH